jgi:hypothetical protein
MAGVTINDNELLKWDPTKTAMQVRLGELVQYFQVGIQNNAQGIPSAYVDPTIMLPYLIDIESPDDLPDDIVMKAKTPISYEDGIPTVEGVPVWERLEGEPIPYYSLFKEYRNMKYIGLDEGGSSFTRSIAKLSSTSQLTGRQLSALARAYHWQMRAKAYDDYKAKEREAIRRREVELLESKHARVSNQLLDQAVTYLLDHPEQLNPKTAIDLTKLAMEAGRLALGLNPDKPGSATHSSGGGTKVNIINQNANASDGSSINMVQADMSPVEQKTKENSQDVGHLQSILHILNASGAFGVAAGQQEEVPQREDDEDYIDADGYSVE